MTEEEWLTSMDPIAMLTFLRDSGNLSERKATLFAFTCGRRNCIILEEAAESIDPYRQIKPSVDALCSRIIDAAERRYEGQESAAAVEALRREMWERLGVPIGLHWDITSTIKGDAPYWVRKFEDTFRSAEEEASADAKEVWRCYTERMFQADLLRDIFGDPFHPLPSLPSALLEANNGMVVRLAKAAYEERVLPSGELEPARVAVLADALEDAGADFVLLNHLRQQEGVHVRGCHVVDLLLGKE